jgi:ABC-type nitrate/sulfonate/bicarbonate transport system substrate-binding protein
VDVSEEPIVPPTLASPRRTRRQIVTWAVGGTVAAIGLGFLGYRAAVGHRPSIRLGIAPGTQTLWRYVAKRQDELFGATKYDLTFLNFSDESALRTSFVQGQIDVMASLVPTVAMLADAGIAAKLFVPTAWLHEGFPFVVPDGSSISDLASLRGRRIAMFPLDHPGIGYWHALILATAQIPLATLRPIETLSPDVSLVQKQVDAACLSGVQWAALQRQTGYHKLTDLQATWSKYSGSQRQLIFGGLIARRQFLDANPEFVDLMVKTHADALQAYKTDRPGFLAVTAAYGAPGAAATPIQANSGESRIPEMTVEQNQSQATYLGFDDVGVDRIVIGDDDVADYGRLFALMAQSGFLKAPPSDVPGFFYRARRS